MPILLRRYLLIFALCLAAFVAGHFSGRSYQYHSQADTGNATFLLLLPDDPKFRPIGVTSVYDTPMVEEYLKDGNAVLLIKNPDEDSWRIGSVRPIPPAK